MFVPGISYGSYSLNKTPNPLSGKHANSTLFPRVTLSHSKTLTFYLYEFYRERNKFAYAFNL